MFMGFIVGCRGKVQLGGSDTEFSLVGPTKVKARKSIFTNTEWTLKWCITHLQDLSDVVGKHPKIWDIGRYIFDPVLAPLAREKIVLGHPIFPNPAHTFFAKSQGQLSRWIGGVLVTEWHFFVSDFYKLPHLFCSQGDKTTSVKNKMFCLPSMQEKEWGRQPWLLACSGLRQSSPWRRPWRRSQRCLLSWMGPPHWSHPCRRHGTSRPLVL